MTTLEKVAITIWAIQLLGIILIIVAAYRSPLIPADDQGDIKCPCCGNPCPVSDVYDHGMCESCRPSPSRSLVITEDEVVKFFSENHGLKFKCKNCGSIKNAHEVSRSYCTGCSYFLCPTCAGDLCQECKR